MFVGSYTPKLDEKNRLFLPAKFREQLAEGLVVTKGQDFCLTVFPLADFAAMTGRIQEAPLTVRQAREYGAVPGDAGQPRTSPTSRAGSPSRRCSRSTPASIATWS